MYVDIRSRVEPGKDTHRLGNAHFEVYWEGLLFIPGVQAGLPSAQSFLDSLPPDDDTQTLAGRTLTLRGSWTLFLHVLRDGSWLACSDHSHQSYLCHSADAVSSSFLRMRDEVPDKSALSEQALAAFLCTGFCSECNAFYEDLKILDYRNYVALKNGGLTVESKRLPSPFERTHSHGRFLDTVDHLFSSLRGERLSVDLSGGTDSRLLVTCLKHLGYDFDAATEGDDSYSEVGIAKGVADILGVTLRHRSLEPQDLAEHDLHDAWLACDGLDLPLLSYKFETWRQGRGYTVAVSGLAGELYKDGGWYRVALSSRLSRNPTISLIDRIIGSAELITWEGVSYEDIFSMLTPGLGRQVREWIAGMRTRLVEEYAKYPVLEAGDRIFFDFSINRPAGTRLAGMPHYTPLTEPDLVRIGTNLPVMGRLNHRFYRKEIGALNAGVAALPTDRGGLTMSSRLWDQPAEWAKYLRYYLSGRGLGTVRKFKTENRNKSAVDRLILGSGDLEAALVNLKNHGIVDAAFAGPTIFQAKRLLMLHYLLGGGD